MGRLTGSRRACCERARVAWRCTRSVEHDSLWTNGQLLWKLWQSTRTLSTSSKLSTQRGWGEGGVERAKSVRDSSTLKPKFAACPPPSLDPSSPQLLCFTLHISGLHREPDVSDSCTNHSPSLLSPRHCTELRSIFACSLSSTRSSPPLKNTASKDSAFHEPRTHLVRQEASSASDCSCDADEGPGPAEGFAGGEGSYGVGQGCQKSVRRGEGFGRGQAEAVEVGGRSWEATRCWVEIGDWLVGRRVWEEVTKECEGIQDCVLEGSCCVDWRRGNRQCRQQGAESRPLWSPCSPQSACKRAGVDFELQASSSPALLALRPTGKNPAPTGSVQRELPLPGWSLRLAPLPVGSYPLNLGCFLLPLEGVERLRRSR